MSSDIMHDFVAKEINAMYSSYDGWKITQRNHATGYDTIATLERRNGGHHDIVKVLVTFNKEIPANLVEELNKKEKATDGMPSRYDSAVIAPVNADTSVLPAGMKIYPMNSFEFHGNELQWIKKKVAKAPEAMEKKPA